jgi:DNA polymerase-3 subunit gamma/tau
MVMLRMLTFRPEVVKTNAHQVVVDTVKKQEIKEPVPKKEQKQISSEEIEQEDATQINTTDSNNWSEMLVAMKLHGRTRELANNCVLESLNDKACSLILDPSHAQLGTKTEEKLQKALQEYCGKPVKLTIKSATTDNATPAQQLTQQREDKQKAAVNSIAEDENVKALKEHFDARVMPGTIEPI